MRLRTRLLAVVSATALASVPLIIAGGTTAEAKPFNFNSLKPIQKRIISGMAAYALGGSPTHNGVHSNVVIKPGGDDDEASAEAPSRPPNNYFPTDTRGCPVSHGDDIKVNQDCNTVADGDLQGRSQAQNETAIAYDPNNSQNLVATMNDYRRGDGNCGSAYSHDGGNTDR